MSSEAGKKELCRDIDEVQNLIERCLQLYMSQKEVVETLLNRAKIEPCFTELEAGALATVYMLTCTVNENDKTNEPLLISQMKSSVWKKLEEENQEFFKAYHIRLMAKHQIMIFNELLEKQVELMWQMHAAEVAIQPTLGVHEFYPDNTLASSWPDKIPHQAGTSTIIGNDWLAMHSSNDATVHTGRFDVFPGMPLTNSQLTMIKSESNYSSNSALAFGNNGSTHEVHSTSNEPISFHANAEEDHLLKLLPPDIDNSIFGFLGPPRKFGPSDLADGFSQR